MHSKRTYLLNIALTSDVSFYEKDFSEEGLELNPLEKSSQASLRDEDENYYSSVRLEDVESFSLY